jgi:hypothetical protein
VTEATKLFREEAKLESVQCLGCGGPIALHGFGAVQRVICPHCGSALQPEDSGALSLLQKAARAHQDSALRLHARGKLDGVTWEVIGICWRRCVVGGIAYPWQEFFLFNPYKGYRFLIYSMMDGHWSLGHMLTAAPQIIEAKHHSIEHKKRRYKHFQGADAVVTYVEGEFTWQVQVGDAAHIDDFVAPPFGISIEQAAGPDGVELTRTLQRHVDLAELASFGADPPKPHGVGPLEPNRWSGELRALWLSCLAFFAVWVAITWFVSSRATEREIFLRTDQPFDAPLSEEISIGTPGSLTNVEVSFTAQPLDNSWAFAEVMLVNLETEEAVGVGLEASYYHGFEDGGWSEGDLQPDHVIGRVHGGRYLLQVNPQRDTSALGNSLGFSLAGVPRSPEKYSVRLREDVFLTRYAVIPPLIILFFPLLAQLLASRFERRRWHNSDYGE